MKLNFAITSTRRKLLFYSTLLFLLQSLVPAFQGVMAKSTAGYTDTICTMYGQITVFVRLDQDQQQDRLKCYDCSVCITQANLNAQPVIHDLLLATRYLRGQNSLSGPLSRVTGPALLLNFLSRAPPA